mmetsp:Transcript_24650/g.88093  ORF Transcript_24650/g.88093 Transcript_24650/m.88093 type:complete len:241 (+) Transcript_24650:571-1293(+)
MSGLSALNSGKTTPGRAGPAGSAQPTAHVSPPRAHCDASASPRWPIESSPQRNMILPMSCTKPTSWNQSAWPAAPRHFHCPSQFFNQHRRFQPASARLGADPLCGLEHVHEVRQREVGVRRVDVALEFGKRLAHRHARATGAVGERVLGLHGLNKVDGLVRAHVAVVRRHDGRAVAQLRIVAELGRVLGRAVDGLFRLRHRLEFARAAARRAQAPVAVRRAERLKLLLEHFRVELVRHAA